MTTFQHIVESLERSGLVVELPDSPPETIDGIAEDSRRVGPGWLFCAVEGTAEDGHAYLPDARSRGAAAAIVTRRSDVLLPQIVVSDSRAAVAIAAAEWFGNPAGDIEIVGITGTNGKSTTASLLQHLLNENGDTGVIGTLGAFDGSGTAVYEEGLTTPGPVQLQATLDHMRSIGVKKLAMEVSSHALDQHRVDGLAFASAVFTNLTHDHLDYHASFEEYFEAKQRLVRLVRDAGNVVVNADEAVWSRLEIPDEQRTIFYGVSPTALVRGEDVQLRDDGSAFRVFFGDESVDVRTPLLGSFNVSNALAAAATAWTSGVSVSSIAARLADAPQVSGRMERLWAQQFLILRDYAHTPDALRSAIGAARPLTRGKLIVLFGCGGDRDRRKRAPMGSIAAAAADLAIVTSDNPRTEDPDRIIDDIVEGMAGRAHLRITDRREAIGRAIGMLHEGDCLLLAGKGHETYQVIGTDRSPFDEREIVADILGGRAAS